MLLESSGEKGKIWYRFAPRIRQATTRLLATIGLASLTDGVVKWMQFIENTVYIYRNVVYSTLGALFQLIWNDVPPWFVDIYTVILLVFTSMNISSLRILNKDLLSMIIYYDPKKFGWTTALICTVVSLLLLPIAIPSLVILYVFCAACVLLWALRRRFDVDVLILRKIRIVWESVGGVVFAFIILLFINFQYHLIH